MQKIKDFFYYNKKEVILSCIFISIISGVIFFKSNQETTETNEN